MYSPTCTGRSETTPEIGARTTASFELLGGEIVGGAAILQQRLLAARGVDRGLIGGFGHLQTRLRGLQIDRRHHAASGERLRALDGWRARRHGWPARSSPIRSRRRAAACRRRRSAPCMPSCARVWRSALSARASASASSCGSSLTSGSPTRTSRPISTSTSRTTPGGLGADLRLVRRHQRPGEVHLPLDRHPLNGRGVDRDRPARRRRGSGRRRADCKLLSGRRIAQSAGKLEIPNHFWVPRYVYDRTAQTVTDPGKMMPKPLPADELDWAGALPVPEQLHQRGAVRAADAQDGAVRRAPGAGRRRPAAPSP